GYSKLTGVDIDLPALKEIPPEIPAACADGQYLPFKNGSFAACLCHFFLLWVKDPLKALLEMKRVARPGGWLLALAEPDYGARLDEPAELKPLGELQTQALQRQGADPFIGARLPDLFRQAGLTAIESGTLERKDDIQPNAEDIEQEWLVLAADLRGMLSPAELERWRSVEQATWASGRRVLHVPLHYAFGQIPL
ncbi:methyltransferase domain-containing protein, partial [Patescibacteria group bacterium]|nr:methyltransferase domain-containing protein [Patescibacteria group bacterium]